MSPVPASAITIADGKITIDAELARAEARPARHSPARDRRVLLEEFYATSSRGASHIRAWRRSGTPQRDKLFSASTSYCKL